MPAPAPAAPLAPLLASCSVDPATLPANFERLSHRVTMAPQPLISLLAKRILARSLAQLHERPDLSLRPQFSLRLRELATTETELSSVYANAHSAVAELAQVRWDVSNEELRQWTPRHLLDTTQECDRASKLQGTQILLVFNPTLAPYLLSLASCIGRPADLEVYIGLGSFYAMRLYEILASMRQVGRWRVSIEQFRQCMDCAPQLDSLGQPLLSKSGGPKMKFSRTTQLITHVVESARQQLQHTPLAFTYGLLTTQSGPGRPTTVGLEFRLLSGPDTSSPPRPVKGTAELLFPAHSTVLTAGPSEQPATLVFAPPLPAGAGSTGASRFAAKPSHLKRGKKLVK